MTALRHALQILGLIVSLPFSAWGAVQLMTEADKRPLLRQNLGLDRPGEMADAWAKVRARPWSAHAWKDVTAEFCAQVHSQVPAKILAALVVLAFVAGFLAGCGGLGTVPGTPGAPDQAEGAHGRAVAVVEWVRLF